MGIKIEFNKKIIKKKIRRYDLKNFWFIHDSRQLLVGARRNFGKKNPLIMIWYHSIPGHTFFFYLKIMKGIFLSKLHWSKRGFFVRKLLAPNWRESYILKLCLRSCQKWPIKSYKTFFLTHRKTKNPRSKKFRNMGFMKKFSI